MRNTEAFKAIDAIAVQISEAFPGHKVRVDCERNYFNPENDVTIYTKVDNIGAYVTVPKDCDKIGEVADHLVYLVKEKMNEI